MTDNQIRVRYMSINVVSSDARSSRTSIADSCPAFMDSIGSRRHPQSPSDHVPVRQHADYK